MKCEEIEVKDSESSCYCCRKFKVTGHHTRNCPRSSPKKEEKVTLEEQEQLPKPGRSWLSCDQSYTLIFCHLETLRSSHSPTPNLLQLAAVSSPASTQREFFRPVLPQDVTKYLDRCKLGGDLLQAVHMTRNDGTFYFRQRFDVSQVLPIVCVAEDAALQDFFSFLESVGANVILVCVDEDTVATLLDKLESLDKARCIRLVQGYTWWKRVGKHLAVPGFRNLELVDYYQSFQGAACPSLHTAPVVASMLKSCVGELVRSQCGMEPASGQVVFLVAASAQLRPKARVRKVEEDREVLEVYSSIQPDVLTIIAVEELEQLDVSSDPEEEYSEQGYGKAMKEEVKDETINISHVLPHSPTPPCGNTKGYICNWCKEESHACQSREEHQRLHNVYIEACTVYKDMQDAKTTQRELNLLTGKLVMCECGKCYPPTRTHKKDHMEGRKHQNFLKNKLLSKINEDDLKQMLLNHYHGE